MPRAPRLSPADLEDLAARHTVVSARVVASEEIARHVIREPVADATRHLMASVARDTSTAQGVKRSVFSGVQALSEALVGATRSAVTTARDHARALATGQAASDLTSFAQKAKALGFPVKPAHAQPDAHGGSHGALSALHLLPSTREQESAIGHQAGLSLAHKWSSQMLGNYVQWKRGGAGTDSLVRAFERAGGGEHGGEAKGPMADLLETHAITHAVDAYADQHALVWRDITRQVEQVDDLAKADPESAWMAGLFDVWSAMLDRRTCSVCGALDGEMVKLGDEFPGGRAPRHPRCRCVACSLWVPEAALKSLPGTKLDYAALKADVAAYAKGASLDIGEGRRHAQTFYEKAIASDSRTALADALSQRRGYFSGMEQQRAPRLRF